MNRLVKTLCLWAVLILVSANLDFAQADENEAMAKLCEEGNSTACFKIGDSARTLDRDNKKALSYYLKACDGGHMTGCNFAGIFTQMSGKQYSPEWKKAVKLFQKACDAGEDGACFNIGTLKYKEGRASAAKKYYKQACDMGNQSGCTNLKRLQK